MAPAPRHVLIVGGGSAGCVLARRFTDDDAPDGVRVTMLETGLDNRTDERPAHMVSPMPGDIIGDDAWAFPQLLARRAAGQQPALCVRSTGAAIHPQAHAPTVAPLLPLPQSAGGLTSVPHARNPAVHPPFPYAHNTCNRYWRGRGLGGSSTINGMQTIRGTPEDFDAWESMGCTGWGADDVLPFFKKFETDLDFGSETSENHGGNGPFPIQRLPASDRSKWGPVDAAFYDAAMGMGWAEVPDHNSFER